MLGVAAANDAPAADSKRKTVVTTVLSGVDLSVEVNLMQMKDGTPNPTVSHISIWIEQHTPISISGHPYGESSRIRGYLLLSLQYAAHTTRSAQESLHPVARATVPMYRPTAAP